MSSRDEDQLARTIGKAIARYRQQAGLTQDEVAERLEIGGEAVSRMERGIVIPTVARLVELADMFQCEAADLLTQASNRPSDQALHLNQLLARLDGEDRLLVVDVIEKLTTRLGTSGRSRSGHPVKPRQR